MEGETFVQKLKYACSIALMHGVTLLVVWSVVTPWIFPKPPSANAQIFRTPDALSEPSSSAQIVLKGKPARIFIPSLGLSLNILDGAYDPADKSWTLSGYNPHFALPTVPANDIAGNTFVYGHNNKHVFGPLKALKPGDAAIIHADNGLKFTYVFDKASDYSPNDTSIFSYDGPPILTLQTCSGAWNEVRRMYQFNFRSVE